MKIQPAVSLWNYNHYHPAPHLEELLVLLRKHDFGVELWNAWQGDEDLYQKKSWTRIKNALEGMRVSLHSTIGIQELDAHRRQIEAAAAFDAQVLVIHADNLYHPGSKRLNLPLTRQLVEEAAAAGVTLALENGQLPVLARAVEEVPDLKICLDTGHVYLVQETMAEFLDAFRDRIVHLHLQEILASHEQHLVGEGGIILDHYTPGTGGILEEDWHLLFRTLEEIDFQGMGVFEIQPRNPLQTAELGSRFMEKILDDLALPGLNPPAGS